MSDDHLIIRKLP
jgi:hypothetical protein